MHMYKPLQLHSVGRTGAGRENKQLWSFKCILEYTDCLFWALMVVQKVFSFKSLQIRQLTKNKIRQFSNWRMFFSTTIDEIRQQIDEKETYAEERQ